MAPALRRCFLSLTIITLLVPFLASAALPPAGGSSPSKTEDACKTGEARITPNSGSAMGKAILGGVRTSNRIWVQRGMVAVSCKRLEPWEDETITVCGLDNKCKDYRKDSLQGQNLEEIIDEALRGGSRFYDGTYGVNPQELTRRLLDPADYSKAEDVILHSRMPGGGDIGNEHVIDAIISYASRDSLLNSNARDSARQAIDEIAEASSRGMTSPVQKFPEKYPPSWNLSSGIALHDALPPEQQDASPQVYTIRAQSPTTFEERWSSVPMTFDYRWSNVSPTPQSNPTFYQRLLDMFSIFKFW